MTFNLSGLIIDFIETAIIMCVTFQNSFLVFALSREYLTTIKHHKTLSSYNSYNRQQAEVTSIQQRSTQSLNKDL